MEDICLQESQHPAVRGLKPVKEWKSYAIKGFPGSFFIGFHSLLFSSPELSFDVTNKICCISYNPYVVKPLSLGKPRPSDVKRH